MSNVLNTKVSVGSGGAPMPGTVNGGSAKGSKQGSISGKLAAAPAGNGAELGGKIVGFGSAKPHASTVNAVGGSVGRAPAIDNLKQVRGFSGSGIKAGKIGG